MGIIALRSTAGGGPPALAPPLSEPRVRLAGAIAALNVAVEEMETAGQPCRRLGAALQACEAAARELAELRASDDAILATWLAEACPGPRPEPSGATLAAERRLAQLMRDGMAARSALPDAEAVFQRCAEIVRQLQRERDEAVHIVAVEAAERVAAELTAALNVALKAEARIRGLQTALLAIAQRGDSSAYAAIERLNKLIKAAKEAAGVPHNPEAGRRLLDALAVDATAELED